MSFLSLLNMHIFKTSFFLTFLLISLSASSQDNFDFLGESTLSIGSKLSKTYSMDFVFRSRYFLHKEVFQYEQQQVDVFHFSNFRLNAAKKLSFGLYYRNRDWFKSGSDELRFLQELNASKQKTGFKLAHRLRLEQRIFDTFSVLRPRYRFAIDLPLNGNTLDVGEAYFVGSTEALVSVSKEHTPLLDQRFTSLFGWLVSKNVKLQSGLEYRWESFNTKANNFLFFATSAVLKI